MAVGDRLGVRLRALHAVRRRLLHCLLAQAGFGLNPLCARRAWRLIFLTPMAKFKTAKFHVTNAAGTVLELDLAVNISAEGLFYANVPQQYEGAFKSSSCYVGLGKPPKTGFFVVKAAQYDKLEAEVSAALRRHIEPEITETPVIRYNIESHVSFAEDAEGRLFPNAAYPGAKWPLADSKHFGGHHATAPSRGGYSLTIGARAELKRVVRYGEHERVSYSRYDKGGSHHGLDNPAQRLNSWAAFTLPDNPREMPYSDEAALFFHNLMLGMAELSRRIQMATFDSDRLQQLIAKQGGAPMLMAPARHD